MRMFRYSTEETGNYTKMYDKQRRRWQGVRLGGEVRGTAVQKET
jgi:hypothetical protein